MKPVLLIALVLANTALRLPAAAVEVRLAGKNGTFQLLREGKPYLIRGAGGDDRALESIAAAGGNSIRLWGDERLGETLDAAHKSGLTVTAGIWLGQVRQGFDWTDADALAKQSSHVRATVEKFKSHPALLMWALGNEMEDPHGKNGAVWTGINSLSTMVKQLDPHHPTMTVIAEAGGDKIKNLHRLCPEIDIIGINSYGGAATLGERYKKAGGTKPYVLTEFGTQGIWEVQRDAIGAYPERTSTEKAGEYRRAYQENVTGQSGVCLGSYAFYWGQKQEVTSTWFSMVLADGSRLAPAETIAELWTGQSPANRCPLVHSLKLDGPPEGKPGTGLSAKLESSDPEDDPLKTTWRFQRDQEEFGTGGDAEAAPPEFPGAIVQSDAKSASLRLPQEGGLYRLFVFVRDTHGGAATANVTLRVDAPVFPSKGRRVDLPLSVYGEGGGETYVPAGWIGNTKAIRLDPTFPNKPHAGKTCLRCEFNATEGWGGVVWQSPAGDWGDRRGGCDLTGAKKVTFWARGEKGGEVVNFQFGMIAPPKKFSDTGKGSLEKVSLTPEWKRYEIPVTGQDLTRIKTGFAWTATSAGESPLVFFLDDIQWE